MSTRLLALTLGALTLGVTLASAEPIIKPRKYHGPIPQSMLWLRVGFMGGASNEEMNTYLDGLIQEPFEKTTEDEARKAAGEFKAIFVKSLPAKKA